MHYKQNNKESKTYVQGLRPFGNTLPRSVKGILKKNGYNYSEIISKWSMLVGKDISNCSYPQSIKMKKGNSNGTLILAVNRGDEIKLQTFGSEINKKREKKIIGKFSKNLQEKINEVKSKSIKNSLSQLLKTIKNG